MRSIHTPAYQRFVQRLREAREAAGLTQVEVAKAFKRPQSWVANCESGERRVDLIEAAEFARLYGVPITDFLPRG